MLGPQRYPIVLYWAEYRRQKASAGGLLDGRPHLEYKSVLAPHHRSHKDTVQLLVIFF